MKATNLRTILIVALMACVTGGYTRAGNRQLQEKLSKNVKIQIEDATITEALAKIGQAADVTIILSDEAVWKLPYGEATRLGVSLSGPLADSLTEMLNAFFMRFAVGDDEITIYPRPELEHVLGRPSAKQLELLKRIYTTRMKVSNTTSEGAIDLVIHIVENVGPVSLSPYYITEEISEILKTTSSGMTVTLANLLEQTGRMRNLPCWYLSRTDFPDQVPIITMVNWPEFYLTRLSQVVDISFKDERAEVILQRLAGWAGMELVVSKREPSWLDEEITVNMQNITLSQAIRNIVSTINGRMDLLINENTIVVVEPERPRVEKPIKPIASARPKNTANTSEGYVGKISIPMEGGKYFLEFMLRESDLTEEFKQLRNEKIDEIMGRSARIKKLRETLMELEKQQEESETK